VTTDTSSRAGAFAPPAAITVSRQEFITPYTPGQNGLVERFFRGLKEECAWLNNFGSFTEARAAITKWIEW
jgi:transposase InsO family protein